MKYNNTNKIFLHLSPLFARPTCDRSVLCLAAILALGRDRSQQRTPVDNERLTSTPPDCSSAAGTRLSIGTSSSHGDLDNGMGDDGDCGDDEEVDPKTVHAPLLEGEELSDNNMLSTTAVDDRG